MKRLPVSPLPKNPTRLDRLEHAIQSVVCWFIWTDDQHPCLAGIFTACISWGLLLVILILFTLFYFR
jgi:hypothetical protein